MDANAKKILEALNNQIDSNELAAALKADSFEGEYALSDEGLSAIVKQTSGLLSAESAANNPEIIEKISKDLYPKHMKSALTKVEEGLKPVLDKLGIDYSKHEFISDAIPDIQPMLDKLGSGGENKELVASLKEDLRKAKESLTEKEGEFEEKLKARDQEILRDKIHQQFKAKATEKPWAEAYNIPDVKEAILDKVFNKITSKAHLKLTEDGQIIPMQKDFPDKELYNGNKIETFQSLLEPEFEPYLKKSTPENAGGGGHANSNGAENLSEEEKRRIAEHKRQKERAG